MCNITDIKTRKRIGYKVLGYKDNKFYSTFTGQEIKVGRVPRPPRNANRLNNYWTRELDDNTLRTTGFYNKLFAGKTGLFTNIEHAKRMCRYITNLATFDDKIKIVLVKIKFDNTTFLGEYSSNEVICSDVIKSIEIVNHEN